MEKFSREKKNQLAFLSPMQWPGIDGNKNGNAKETFARLKSLARIILLLTLCPLLSEMNLLQNGTFITINQTEQPVHSHQQTEQTAALITQD